MYNVEYVEPNMASQIAASRSKAIYNVMWGEFLNFEKATD